MRNPLIELQAEVLKVVKDCTGKKECAELVKNAFKAKEPGIYNSTSSIWFKKYEAEAREKFSLEKNAEKQTQSSKMRSSRLLHETEEDCDLLPERDIVVKQHQSGLPHLLDHVSQDLSPNNEKPYRYSMGGLHKKVPTIAAQSGRKDLHGQVLIGVKLRAQREERAADQPESGSSHT